MKTFLRSAKAISLFALSVSLFVCANKSFAQNSLVGDGFGGRSWYKPHNYQVGAYSAFTVCDSNNQLYGWGGNEHGEIGNGTNFGSVTPVAVSGMNHIIFYTTGYLSAAIKNDNTAWVWGLGYPTSGFTTLPQQVLTNVRFADGGSSHAIFVKKDRTVWGVGANSNGELGNGTFSINPVTTPVKMTSITNAVRAVALGYYTENATIILLSDGTVKITGGGNSTFTTTNTTVPVTLPGLTNIVDIKGGAYAGYALNAAGAVYSFGKGYQGSLGLGTLAGYNPPTQIIFPAGAAPIIALSANNDGNCVLALDENGKVYGWGANAVGQLGIGTFTHQLIPVLVASNVVDIYAGETFTYILKADNTLWASGQSGWSGITGSMWMNLTNIGRNVYTKIDPTIAPMNLCPPKVMGVIQQTTTAGFNAPDTVCVNTPVNITNTSTGATNYYWNFCVAGASTTIPTGASIGSFNPPLNLTAFVDYAFDNGNYYGFVTNNFPGKVVRLDFGNSLLNTPTAVDLGNFGGVVPNYCEGIQVIKNEGQWYAIIVGGQPVGRIVNLNFGASLSNTSPVATNWGNIGNLSYPHDLHVFQDSANWYGFTVNATSNTVTRFNFTNSFSNTPTGVNLGNLGNLDFPTGIYAISDNTNWHVFITSATGTGNNPGTSLTRLDFGNSFLNTPTGVNLGNLGVLRTARDLTIYKSCDEIIGYIVNYSATNDIVRLNFNNNLTATPTATSIGNIGNLDFPVCLTKIFRVNNDLYSFITNANTNAISRLKFSGCSNSSIPSSIAASPPAITYNTPGTYYINLTIDEGLATQQSFCRQIVVKNCSVAIVPDCSPGRFYGIGSDYKLYAFTIANDSVIYNGAIAGDTFNVHPGSLGIARLDSAMCFYSNSNTNSTLLQLKNNWESIHAYNGGIYNAGGQDSFLYYHTFGGGQNILRYNGVSLSTTYFGANAIFQDIAVDSIGNVYFLSDNGGNSSILRKISPTGVVVDNDTIAVGGYNGFGCFIMGNVLYLGYGSINAYHPNTLIPVTLNSTAPVVGNPIRMPSQPLIADLASCAKVNVQLPCTNPPAAPTVSVTQPICTTPTGTIIITSSPGLTYSINGVTYDSTTTFTGLASGSYNVTAQNSSGCTSAANVVTIIQPGIPPAPTLAITQPNCTSPTGTITVTTPIGATFTYSIDGVDYSNTTGVFTGVAQGTYNVTVKTGGGCLSPATTSTINAAPPVPPAPTITVTQPTCTTPTGTITITPTAGFTYSINGTTYDTTTVFNNLAAGTYNVTAQNSSGCVSAATAVTINAASGTPPAPTFIITQPNCTSFTGTITITAPLGAGLTYSIDGVTYTNISGIFTGIAQGAYNVTVKTGGGCLSTTTTATINAAPPVPAAPTVTVTQPTCTTPTGTITITSPPGLTYSINGTTYDTTTIYTGVAPGSYNLTAQISGGCVSAATVVIINAAPGTPPAPTLAITQPNCTSSTGTITITAPIGAAFTYSIDGVDYTNTTGVFAGLVPGSYNVNVRNSSGCTSTTTVAVINTDPVIPPAPTVAITQPGCLVSLGTITVTFPIAGATTYSIDGVTYVPNNVFSGVAPGTYNVTISNGSCISTGTVATVNATPALLLTLTATPNPVSAGSTVTFTVTGNTPFTVTGWQPVANFPNQSATTQTIVVNTPLTAIVSGTRADNCMDTAEVSVTLNSVDDVWVPNTFTPNHSGLNDILYVYGSSIDKLQFTIWNQWGEKIFTTSNKAEGWDGTSKGKPQPVGVYVYVAKAVLFNGKEVMKKGAVNLIR